jgi:hypothetical protein
VASPLEFGGPFDETFPIFPIAKIWLRTNSFIDFFFLLSFPDLKLTQKPFEPQNSQYASIQLRRAGLARSRIHRSDRRGNVE